MYRFDEEQRLAPDQYRPLYIGDSAPWQGRKPSAVGTVAASSVHVYRASAWCGRVDCRQGMSRIETKHVRDLYCIRL